jgi:arginine utilization regulatory protein
MPLNLQAKLLRVIQEKKVRRVGGSCEIGVDLKIISTINQKPEAALKNGQLRPDLYFRLAVIFLEIPALRYRGDDVAALIGHFVKAFNRKLQGRINSVEPEFVEVMRRYSWPGNVRELEHVIETCMNFAVMDPNRRRTLGLCHIQTAHLRRFLSRNASGGEAGPGGGPDRLPGRGGNGISDRGGYGGHGAEGAARGVGGNGPDAEANAAMPLKEELDAIEADRIGRALSAAGGNRARAAKLLGLSRQNLFYRIKRLRGVKGLPPGLLPAAPGPGPAG